MQLPQNVSARRAVDGGIIFTVLVCIAVILMGTWLLRYEIAQPLPTDTEMFYDWKLAEPNFWSRVTVWVGFALHNLLIWGTIYWAQERSSRKYTENLKPFNWVALAINAVFVILHYLQTMFFYDGIAQDIPSWTSQSTVIMMLYVIMMIENRRRGMFFGKKLNFKAEFYHWLKTYHGYAFSFAVIYTFWYHPMVPTQGHILGIVNVLFVMLQGSVMFTRMHVNRNWIFLNEIIVLPHAALVALNQGGDVVYMFMYGFLTIFIVTQIHGLGLKPWLKNGLMAGYALTLVYVYGFIRPTYMINEIFRIPLTDYLLIFLTYGGWLAFARITGKIDRFRATEPPPPVPAAGD